MDDRYDVTAKSMWEDYQCRLAARISDEDEDNSSDGDGDGDKTESHIIFILCILCIPPLY
jgi:hypothetical protein